MRINPRRMNAPTAALRALVGAFGGADQIDYRDPRRTRLGSVAPIEATRHAAPPALRSSAALICVIRVIRGQTGLLQSEEVTSHLATTRRVALGPGDDEAEGQGQADNRSRHRGDSPFCAEVDGPMAPTSRWKSAPRPAALRSSVLARSHSARLRAKPKTHIARPTARRHPRPRPPRPCGEGGACSTGVV